MGDIRSAQDPLASARTRALEGDHGGLVEVHRFLAGIGVKGGLIASRGQHATVPTEYLSGQRVRGGQARLQFVPRELVSVDHPRSAAALHILGRVRRADQTVKVDGRNPAAQA